MTEREKHKKYICKAHEDIQNVSCYSIQPLILLRLVDL